MNRQEINEKMEQSLKQGTIFVSDLDHSIIEVSINGWDKKHRCIYLPTECGFYMPIYAANYGKKYYGWSLTREELEK